MIGSGGDGDMKSVWAALAAAAVSIGSVAGIALTQPAEAEPTSISSDADVAAFAAYLAERRRARDAAGAEAEAAPRDPFAQLDRIGLDGTGLRAAVDRAGVYLGTLAEFDLASIDVDGIDADARRCLTQAIYYEARNQSVAGRLAVADVVLNRVENPRYPSTVCGVVYQGSKRRTGCQFSFTCDGSMRARVERGAMVEAQTLATAVLGGFRLALTDGATNYHATYVNPYWAPSLTKTAKVGDHVFYRRGRARAQLALLD